MISTTTLVMLFQHYINHHHIDIIIKSWLHHSTINLIRDIKQSSEYSSASSDEIKKAVNKRANDILVTVRYAILYYTMLYYDYAILCYTMTMLYYNILCYTIRYCAILYCTILCYTMLYYDYAILCNTMLYYTILYYSILCYTALIWYTVLYYNHQSYYYRYNSDTNVHEYSVKRLIAYFLLLIVL